MGFEGLSYEEWKSVVKPLLDANRADPDTTVFQSASAAIKAHRAVSELCVNYV